MRIYMRFLRLLAPFWLSLCLVAIAQSAPDSNLNVPPDHIRIPVLVTDKQGKPIFGLRADDFRVLDNGKPASIAAFLAFSTTPPAPAHFTVFYLDDRHLSLDQMNSAKQAVAAALSTALDSNGYVAIVTGTGSANSGFSRDAAQLRNTLNPIQATPFAAVGTRAHDFDLIGTYASLGNYASRMSKLPGRRLLVLLSPGFSSDFPEIRFAAADSINRIVQSGVLLNTLNIQRPGSASLNEDNVGLEELSAATGGSSFLDDSSLSDLSQYPELLYLIDISLSVIRADGSSHKLKIVISRPGSRLRARDSFVAPTK
jgi:VWFA-related protein